MIEFIKTYDDTRSSVPQPEVRIKLTLSEDQITILKEDTTGNIVWYNRALVLKKGLVAQAGIVDIYAQE